LDWTTGPLAEGLRCYRAQQFFEAHEHWETVWLTLSEPEKSFLQSLVQISAAFHHLRRGNRVGAISLLTRALGRLERADPHFCGLDVGSLRDHVRVWLSALHDELVHTPDYPEFRVLDHPGELKDERS
jgi:predicted metal-dependent hydrolase